MCPVQTHTFPFHPHNLEVGSSITYFYRWSEAQRSILSCVTEMVNPSHSLSLESKFLMIMPKLTTSEHRENCFSKDSHFPPSKYNGIYTLSCDCVLTDHPPPKCNSLPVIFQSQKLQLVFTLEISKYIFMVKVIKTRVCSLPIVVFLSYYRVLPNILNSIVW